MNPIIDIVKGQIRVTLAEAVKLIDNVSNDRHLVFKLGEVQMLISFYVLFDCETEKKELQTLLETLKQVTIIANVPTGLYDYDRVIKVCAKAKKNLQEALTKADSSNQQSLSE